MKPPSAEQRRSRVSLATSENGPSFVCIVQLSSQAAVSFGTSDQAHGTLVDIDVVRELEGLEVDEAWQTVVQELPEARKRCHGLFFRVLKPRTLERLGPAYD